MSFACSLQGRALLGRAERQAGPPPPTQCHDGSPWLRARSAAAAGLHPRLASPTDTPSGQGHSCLHGPSLPPGRAISRGSWRGRARGGLGGGPAGHVVSAFPNPSSLHDSKPGSSLEPSPSPSSSLPRLSSAACRALSISPRLSFWPFRISEQPSRRFAPRLRRRLFASGLKSCTLPPTPHPPSHLPTARAPAATYLPINRPRPLALSSASRTTTTAAPPPPPPPLGQRAIHRELQQATASDFQHHPPPHRLIAELPGVCQHSTGKGLIQLPPR